MNHTIDTDKGVRHNAFDMLYPLLKEFAGIAAVHYFEHLVAARLERYMEVRCKMTAIGDKGDYLIREQVGFARGNTNSELPFYTVQGAEQVDKSFAGTASEIAYIDSRQNNFLSPFGKRSSGRSDNIFDKRIARAPACKGDGAIGTEIIASVLYFEETARAVIAGIGRLKNILALG